MKIRVHLMQATGDFLVPGTRQTVNKTMVRQAVGMLPLRDRDAAIHYMAGGPEPSREVAESIRKAIVEVAEKERERRFPLTEKCRSLS